MSTRQYLIDASTRHAVFLQRYGASQARAARSMLADLQTEIFARLAMEPSAFQAARLGAVLADVTGLVDAAFGGFRQDLITEARQFAAAEAAFAAQMLERATPPGTTFTVPADTQLLAAALSSPMQGAGVDINGALQAFSAKKRAEIVRAIQDGVVLGDPTATIARDVGVIMRTLQRRQITSLVSTAVNHLSSVARAETYAANADVISGYRWVSTLDSHTTLICGSRDNRVYALGAGPMPPAHWSCRSTTVPEVRDEYNIGAQVTGARPAVGDTVTAESTQTTYGAWLRRQSAEFQDSALGPARAELFRSGRLTIDKFVDSTGDVYTLDELQSMYPLAFSADGV